MMRRLRRSLPILLAALAVGCELTEVAAPESADVLVIDAVLRAGSASQGILLHRSLEGTLVRGEPGATGRVVGEDGQVIDFEEAPLPFCTTPATPDLGEEVDLQATCYFNAADGLVTPGATYTLEVTTARGETAFGRTTIPEAFEFTSPGIATPTPGLTGFCHLPSVPFTLAWTQSNGAWAYVVNMRLSEWGDSLRDLGAEVPEILELASVSVSAADTTLLFPANIGLFQRGDVDRRIFEVLNRGIPAEANVTLVVMATDRNYTNAIRGGRFNPSGNVRISSVVGDAVGVFGSVVPLVLRSSPTQPPCPTPLPPTGIQ